MTGVSPAELEGLSATVAEKMARHISRQNRRIKKLVDLSTTDELTGVLRRAAGLAALERELQRARRFESDQVVVAFIDVNGLKQVNDQLGHAAGDRLIRRVAESLRRRLRAYDLVVRWGGDEFLCIFPVTSVVEAQKVLCEVVRDFEGNTGETFSFGVAELGDLVDHPTALALVNLADRRLYEGRQRRK